MKLEKTDCKEELLGRLIDIVEDFLERKGIITEEEPVIVGNDYDELVNAFAVALGLKE